MSVWRCNHHPLYYCITCTRSSLSCLLAFYGIPIFHTFLMEEFLFTCILSTTVLSDIATCLIKTITCYMVAILWRTHVIWQIADTKDEQSRTRWMHRKQGMYATHGYMHWVYWWMPLNVCKRRVKSVIATISVYTSVRLSEGASLWLTHSGK